LEREKEMKFPFGKIIKTAIKLIPLVKQAIKIIKGKKKNEK